jgi:hypothetical protein
MSDVPTLTSKVHAPPDGVIPDSVQTEEAKAFRDVSARYVAASAKLAALSAKQGGAREADRKAREDAAAANKPVPTDAPNFAKLASEFAAQELAVSALADATRTAYLNVTSWLERSGDDLAAEHVAAGEKLAAKIDTALEKVGSLLDEVDHHRNVIAWFDRARDPHRMGGFPWVPSSTTSVQIGSTPVTRSDAFHAIRASAVVAQSNEYAG